MTRLLRASVDPLGSLLLRFSRQKTVSAGPSLEFSGVRQPGPQAPNQGGGVYSEPESTVTLNDSSSITGNVPDNCFPGIC
jgi:hypothetical protein